MIMRTLIAVTATVLLFLAFLPTQVTVTHAQPAYAYMLKILPAWGDNAEATGISSTGTVIGLSQMGSNQSTVPFNWEGHGLRPMTAVPDIVPSAINSQGTIVGTRYYDNQDTQAVVFKHGHWKAFIHHSCNTDANWINDKGQVGGDSCYTVPGGNQESKAAVWTNNTRRIEGSTMQVDSVFTLADNGDAVGAEAGFDDLGNLSPHAYFWTVGGRAVHLHTIGLPGALAYGITEYNGSVLAVGGSFNADANEQATVWRFDRTTQGPVAATAVKGSIAGMALSALFALNNNGMAVGGASDGYGTDTAVVWTQKSGMLDLQRLIKPTSFSLDVALAVNDQGQIVGAGYRQDGSMRGFVLTPTGAALQSASSGRQNRRWASAASSRVSNMPMWMYLPSTHVRALHQPRFLAGVTPVNPDGLSDRKPVLRVFWPNVTARRFALRLSNLSRFR